ncbi:MAG: hypothetical protein ACREE3_15815, partial [Stellaceae bacterium]
MAAPGEMTASLTLRLRDQLSGGIQELREEFQQLNRTLAGMTDVLREVRDALAGLKAPRAMIDGLGAATTEARGTMDAVKQIGGVGEGVGKELGAALTAPLIAVSDEIKGIVAGVKEIGTTAVASGREIKATAAASIGAGGHEKAARRETIGGYWDVMGAAIGGMLGYSMIGNQASFMQPLGHAAITKHLSGPAALKDMQREAKKLQALALKTATSSMELAQAYLKLIMTPLKDKPGLVNRLMPIMAEASTAYNVPVPEMGQALYSLAEVMQVPAAQMLKAFGELAYASKAAHFDMAAFSAGLPELGSAMRLYGATGIKAVTGLASAMEAVVLFTKDPTSATTDVSDLLNYLRSPMGGRMFDRTSRSWKMLPAFERDLLIRYHVP